MKKSKKQFLSTPDQFKNINFAQIFRLPSIIN